MWRTDQQLTEHDAVVHRVKPRPWRGIGMRGQLGLEGLLVRELQVPEDGRYGVEHEPMVIRVLHKVLDLLFKGVDEPADPRSPRKSPYSLLPSPGRLPDPRPQHRGANSGRLLGGNGAAI